MADGREVPLFTPAFITLTLADLAYFTAAGMLLALTPLFVVGPLGAGRAAVGLVMGSFSVTTLALRPWAGRWVDQRGRRLLLVGGAMGFAVLALGHLLVSGLVPLVLLRLLLGAAEALFFVAGFAALADLAPVGRAGAALSFNSLALYAGIGLGPLLAQVLLRAGDFTAGWLGAAACAGLAALLATRVPETLDRSAVPLEPGRLVHRAALRPGLALFTGVAAMAGFFAFAVLRAQEVGLERWSLVLLLFGAVVIGCRIVFADLPDRVAPGGLATAALGAVATGFAVLALAPYVVGLLAGSALVGVGVAFLTPAVFAAVLATAGPTERGVAVGTLSIFIDLGLGLGPMIVGFVAAGLGIGAGLGAAGGLAVVGALVLSAPVGSARPRSGPTPAPRPRRPSGS